MLTIGMSSFDDFDGVYFTLQSLKMHHSLPRKVEFIVVDNNPDSNHGRETAKFVKSWIKGKYIEYKDKKSTSSRNEIFKQATNPYVLCLDCHVLLKEGAVDSLVDYYSKNPNTKNLISGPLYFDDLKDYATHFYPKWRSFMYGVWDSDKEQCEAGEPFEIPMMGLGLFSCKKEHWPGFNERFTGFGGEEGYIHEKFRRNGGKCVCLPQLGWIHRFGRPNGVPYPNLIEDRFRNYLIGWKELGDETFINSIFAEFGKTIPVERMSQIYNEV